MAKNGQPTGRVDLITDAARDSLTVRRVFGEPITQGDLTIIPVARVHGGSGMGYGSGTLDAHRGGSAKKDTTDADPGRAGDAGGEGDGGGGGFGVSVRALGVYVVRGDEVTWRPALDLNKVILGGQIVGAVAVLAIARALRGPRPLVAIPKLPLPHLPRLPRPHLPRLWQAASRRA